MSVRDTLKKSRPKVAALDISTGPVFVKGFNGATRHLFVEASKDGQPPLQFTVALCVCEEDGALLYDMGSEKGRALANLELQDMASADLQKMALKVFELSSVEKDSVSEAEKKSEASPS